jgi:hypothetical protein
MPLYDQLRQCTTPKGVGRVGKAVITLYYATSEVLRSFTY